MLWKSTDKVLLISIYPEIDIVSTSGVGSRTRTAIVQLKNAKQPWVAGTLPSIKLIHKYFVFVMSTD